MRVLLAVLAVVLASGCITEKRIQRAGGRVDLGMAYYREGDLESAVGSLREAARLDPRNWRALNALAVTYIAKGDNEQAEQAFRRALRINPEEAEILVNWGAFRLKTGHRQEAIEAFEQALRDMDYRNPALVQSNLSYALLQDGRLEEALASAREAVRRAPQLCEAWYHVGLVQEAREDELGALEAYGELVKVCPKEDLGARLRQGCLQVRIGMRDEGETGLREVISRAPGTAFADQARACLTGG